MEESLTEKIEHAFAPHLPDDVSVRRWLAFYGLFLLAVGAPLWMLISRQGWSWSAWLAEPVQTFQNTTPAVKLLCFALYVSLCCTFLPLPTGWIVAAVATRQAAVTGNVWTTVLLVGLVGAAGSTIANLNDYHLFTWMLRHHRIAKVRTTRTYQAAARWFAKGPFLIIVVFNIVPIPVDMIRVLATTSRYLHSNAAKMQGMVDEL